MTNHFYRLDFEWVFHHQVRDVDHGRPHTGLRHISKMTSHFFPWSFDELSIVSRKKRIVPQNVFDIGKEQLLVLLLMLQAQFHQRQYFLDFLAI